MLVLLELLGWIADIVMLDLKTMKPAARVAAVVVFGLLGLLFVIGAAIALFEGDKDLWQILGALVVAAIGFGLLARLGYGLAELRRLKREPT